MGSEPVMLTVIVTGLPGVGKTTVLNALKGVSERNGMNISIVNFGTAMSEILRRKGLALDRDDIRRQDMALQREVQEEAAREISKMGGGEILVVDTHMFVKTDCGLWPGLPMNVLSKLSPSLLVLIEAPPEEISNRRASDKSRRRDEASRIVIEQELNWSRSLAAACSVMTGAPVKIINNEPGKHLEAAEELFGIISKMVR
ncbi:MAG: adenylate kinase [Candidatus Bathyarchaeia archaeon]